MTSLHNISVQLSNGQKRNLARAYQRNEEVTLRLSKKSLNGSDTLRVPAQVVKRLQKNRNAGKGMQIKISKANIRKQDGSGIFSSLMPLLKTVAPTIGKTLGLSVVKGVYRAGNQSDCRKKSRDRVSTNQIAERLICIFKMAR